MGLKDNISQQKIWFSDIIQSAVSCYYIIESAVSYMASDRLLQLDQRQRGQLYTALKNGFTSILGFLQELSVTLREQPHHLDNHEKKYFVCATIRILGEGFLAFK